MSKIFGFLATKPLSVWIHDKAIYSGMILLVLKHLYLLFFCMVYAKPQRRTSDTQFTAFHRSVLSLSCPIDILNILSPFSFYAKDCASWQLVLFFKKWGCMLQDLTLNKNARKDPPRLSNKYFSHFLNFFRKFLPL